TNNLPDFSSRSGAMAAGAYISNIAASILDYIDTNNDSTVDSVGVPISSLPKIPAWRGEEAIAWPNELFTRFHFETNDTKLEGALFQYSFKYKHYLEVWNICNREVALVPLILHHNRDFPVRINPLTFSLSNTNFGSVAPIVLSPVGGSPPSLKPGEFGMLESPTLTLRYISPTNKPNSVQFLNCTNYFCISSTNSVTGTKIISATKMGAQIYDTTIPTNKLYGAANGAIFATALGYSCGRYIKAPPPDLKSVGGDPRAQLFLGTWPTKGHPYVKYSSPGGLNWEETSSGSPFINSFVNAKDLWADGGLYKNSDLGASPQDSSQSPEDLYNAKKGKWSTNVALSKINNTGKLTNICELGNIFDPMQWEDSSQLPTAAGGMPGLWTNLSASATKADTACGRTTLRIGRPEFKRFAFTNLGGSKDLAVPNMGQAAVALLDIFCATNALDDGGKININTAPGPVLSALAGGISVSSDPAKVGTEQNARMIRAFTNGVMKFRHTYPFYSPSQLSFISTNYGDANWTNNWPNTAVFSTNIGGGLNGISAMNDQGMEEWFSKIYPLT
ncbi:hypothetical protein EBX31_12530, partial [bacterium]|nr:hypothetical protein [bacterium]